MAEIETVAGPLERSRLAWVADLYGRADPKYRNDELLAHVFTQSPAGAALHAFALDLDRPVGHCAVVPMRARLGREPFRAGKLEALFVAEEHRGRHLARSLLDALYAFSDEQGIELLHAFATERIGGVIRFQRLGGAGRRALVGVIAPRSPAERAVSGVQGTLRRIARSGTESMLRPAESSDLDLAAAPQPPPGRWTVLAEDAWDWYRDSPLVRVLEMGGSRALVQLPGSPGDGFRLIGWSPDRSGLGSALPLVLESWRVARELGAATLRFQPWGSPAAGGALTRACRLLGFVPRSDLTTLWVRAADPALAQREAVVPTPMLYLGF